MGETGYKKIMLSPHFNSQYVSEDVEKQNNKQTLNKVNASLETYYGTLSSNWEKNDETLTYKVKIPVNATAEIHLPAKLEKIQEGGFSILKSKTIKIKEENYGTTLSVGSGSYTFQFNF